MTEESDELVHWWKYVPIENVGLAAVTQTEWCVTRPACRKDLERRNKRAGSRATAPPKKSRKRAA